MLQTFDPGTSEQTIERVESQWKDKLGARLVGYNLTDELPSGTVQVRGAMTHFVAR